MLKVFIVVYSAVIINCYSEDNRDYKRDEELYEYEATNDDG